MNMQMEIAIIGAIQGIAICVITGFFARDSKKRSQMLEKAEVRAALREEESLLSIKLMSASVELGMATAHCIMEGKANGSMAGAMRGAENAAESYQNFFKKVVARQMAKG